MTAKYSADSHSDGSRWTSDTEHILASWSVEPFSGHRHRHERVEIRVVVAFDHGVGGEVRLEARSEDTDHFADGWAAVETVEIREYAARHDRRPEARWLK